MMPACAWTLSAVCRAWTRRFMPCSLVMPRATTTTSRPCWSRWQALSNARSAARRWSARCWRFAPRLTRSPWCLKKCPYCDFNSHEVPGAMPGGLPEQRYLDALVADLEAALPLIWGRTVHSVFIGGGTPSLFSPQAIDRLLSDVRARLPLEADCEITLEANPGTFEKDRFKAFRSAGVTRLSVGVQSFDDRHLKALGRVHDRAQAIAAVEEAAQAFDTFNLDIMYALPGQTMENLEHDMRQALALQPPHISIYQLTIEPNTWFAKFPPVLPEEDLAYAMLDRITEMTHSAGLQRYEVSAYAKPGHRCFHNLNYWQFGDYLGIGAGAHSKLLSLI